MGQRSRHISPARCTRRPTPRPTPCQDWSAVEFVLLLKDTSLVSAIGVTLANKELTRWGREGVIDNANATPLVVAGLVYLLMTIPLTRLVAVLEKRGAKTK